MADGRSACRSRASPSPAPAQQLADQGERRGIADRMGKCQFQRLPDESMEVARPAVHDETRRPRVARNGFTRPATGRQFCSRASRRASGRPCPARRQQQGAGGAGTCRSGNRGNLSTCPGSCFPVARPGVLMRPRPPGLAKADKVKAIASGHPDLRNVRFCARVSLRRRRRHAPRHPSPPC